MITGQNVQKLQNIAILAPYLALVSLTNEQKF